MIRENQTYKDEERHRMANIRHFVNDIEESISFYTQKLGFSLEENSNLSQSFPRRTFGFGSATLEPQRLGQ